MARVALVISFERVTEDGAHGADLKVDPSSAPIMVQHFAPAGDDSQPLKDDFALLDEDEDSAVGYADTRNAGVAGPGEKRIYARASDATVKVHLHLKSDGSAILTNENGQIELKTDGEFHVGANAQSALALAKATDDRIKALEDWAKNFTTNVFNTHTHAVPALGTSGVAAPVGAAPANGASTAAQKSFSE